MQHSNQQKFALFFEQGISPLNLLLYEPNEYFFESWVVKGSAPVLAA